MTYSDVLKALNEKQSRWVLLEDTVEKASSLNTSELHADQTNLF